MTLFLQISDGANQSRGPLNVVFYSYFVLESFGEPRLWVDAVSQNAFDTGAGMGLMIPYSAYMTRKNSIVKYGYLVPATNNLVR